MKLGDQQSHMMPRLCAAQPLCASPTSSRASLPRFCYWPALAIACRLDLTSEPCQHYTIKSTPFDAKVKDVFCAVRLDYLSQINFRQLKLERMLYKEAARTSK